MGEQYYSWSPFNSMNGSPIVNADPYGATIWSAIGSAIGSLFNTWGYILPEVIVTAAKPALTLSYLPGLGRWLQRKRMIRRLKRTRDFVSINS